MIIPRFKYSYTGLDAWEGIKSLFRPAPEQYPFVQKLAPQSSVHVLGSARQGIRIALESFQLPQGARVGVQPYTCSSVLSAIVAAGMVPVFVDVREDLTLSVPDLAAKVAGLESLIVTHLFGCPADIGRIRELTRHIPVIEDCAHALFSQYRGRQVGVFFDASVFSFGNGKFPSLGSGGLLLINNPRLNPYVTERVSRLPSPTFIMEIRHITATFLKAGLHSRPVEGALKVLLSESCLDNRNKGVVPYEKAEYQLFKSTKQLIFERLPQYMAHSVKQHENSLYLSERVKDHYVCVATSGQVTNSFSLVLLDERRDALYSYLRKKNIVAGKHFQHALGWATHYGYKHGECPFFEKVVPTILTVPCNYSLRKKELDWIADNLVKFKTLPNQ